MTCIACDRPNDRPSPTVREMCAACWWKLPAPTRAAYQCGRLKVMRSARKVAR